MASLSFGNAVMAGMQAAADQQMAAQQQAWIDALVGAKLADEATLRSLLSLDAVAPRKRGRPAAGAAAKAKAKVCDVADADRCLGCKWGGGDLDKAHCSAAADGERSDQLCSACGGNWDVVWADRKADGRVTFGPKADNPSGVAWYGFWGIDRVPVWPGEANCVHTKPGAKTSSGNGVSLAKSLDAAAGGSRKHGVWHKAREAWVAAAAVEAPAELQAELQADATVVAEADATVVPEADARTGVERSFDGLAYTTYKDETSSPVTTHVWPIGEWLASAGYESKVAVTLTDLDTAVGFVDEDGDIIFTDYEIGEVHEAASKPTSSD
jgi:hypothetical protein